MSKKLITACLGLVAFAAFVLPAVAMASPEVGETKSPGVWTKLEPTTGECTAVKETICVTAKNVTGSVTKLKTDPAEGTATATLAECSTAVMTAYLKKNNGTEVEATIHTATFEGGGTGGKINGMEECKGTLFGGDLVPTTNGNNVDNENIENGTPWCLKATKFMAADEFQISGGDCEATAKKITYILDTTFSSGVITQCKYERGASEPIKGTFTTDPVGGNQDAVLSVKPGSTTAERAKTTFKGETGNSILCPSTGTLEMEFTLETDNTNKEPLYIR